jgi:hypothetical protein
VESDMLKIVRMFIFLALVGAIVFAAGQAHTVKALPEYSNQVGEPCASCHISPSGGGPRGARGQAWVGSGKPGAVPDQDAALALLGVKLDIKKADFVAVPGAVPAAQPLTVKPGGEKKVYQWLKDYQGN